MTKEQSRKAEEWNAYNSDKGTLFKVIHDLESIESASIQDDTTRNYISNLINEYKKEANTWRGDSFGRHSED
jgi:hypothetical protein